MRALPADVFPGDEHPGSEIIATLTAPGRSNSIIRVYSLRGDILFESWHFGPIFQIEWWAEKGLILAVADRHGKQTHTWDARGYPGIEFQYPRIILAISPKDYSHTDLRWLDDSAKAGAASPLRWYKALWPPESTDRFTLRIGMPHHQDDRARSFRLLLKPHESRRGPPSSGAVSHPTGGFELEIDESGQILPDRPDLSDGWQRAFGKDHGAARRAAELYRLIDFPTGVSSAPAPPPR